MNNTFLLICFIPPSLKAKYEYQQEPMNGYQYIEIGLLTLN